MSIRKPRARTLTSDSTPGGNYTQLFVDLIDAGNAQAQLILKAVAQHADWKSGVCHPRCRTLAEIAKCSDKTVRRYLRQLKTDGILDLGERFDDDNGRQTSNAITLVGYAEWAAAIRTGGVVAAPRIVPRYDAPPGQSDQGGPGQVDQGAMDNLTTPAPGQTDQGPPDNLSRAPGQQVSTLNEPSLELQREGESGASAGFEQVLHGLRTGYPEYRRAIDRLIEPLLRQRKLAGCPDPVYALAEVAKDGSVLADHVLDDAVQRVKATRGFSFKTSDVDNALKAASAASPVSCRADDDPISPATARLREALRLRFGQQLYDAWFAGMVLVQADKDDGVSVSVHARFLKSYIETNYAEELGECTGALFGSKAFRIIVRKPA